MRLNLSRWHPTLCCNGFVVKRENNLMRKVVGYFGKKLLNCLQIPTISLSIWDLIDL